MIKLEKWYLTNRGCYNVAWGYVYGHDKLVDGTHIHTSPIVSIHWNIKEKRLEITTHSNNLYELALEDMNIKPDHLKDTEKSLEFFDISMNIVSEAKILVRAKKRIDLAVADDLTSDGDLLLEVAGNNVMRAYFKQKGRIYPLRIRVHTGMFQDSVLISKYGVVDYRYFPYVCSMSTYYISDGIKRLIIKNIGCSDVMLDNVIYKPYTVTSICVTKDSCREGLLSPDCVNGKSLFSDFIKEDDSE